MSIKDVVEKIKNLFRRNEFKQLPAITQNENSENVGKMVKRREGFLAKNKVKKEPVIDMEEEYNRLLEENERIIKQQHKIMAGMELRANGIEFIEEEIEDIDQFYSEEKQKALSKDKTPGVSKAAERYLANMFWGENTSKYIQDSIAMWTESKLKRDSGEPSILTEEQKRRVKEIDEFILLQVQDHENVGKVYGIRYAAFSNGLTTEENENEKKEIEQFVNEQSRIAELTRQNSETLAIETHGVTKMDRIMYKGDKILDGIEASARFSEVEMIEEYAEKYENYIARGGRVPSLDVFKQTPIALKGLTMSEEEKNELLAEADKRGIPNYNGKLGRGSQDGPNR